MTRRWLYHLKETTKSYGGSPVLQIGGLEVFRGEMLCVVGPTGAGKSTLLRLLAGVEAPTAGQIMFADCRLGSRNVPLEILRRITLVFQRPVLLGGTVRTNVEYGLHLRGRDRRSAHVDEILGSLQLSALASRSCRNLSGGETQLVALARALVLRPEVLLLDEPTANLDPARVALVERTIATVHREQQTTVVWATHNLFQARRVADRVAFLLEGHLVEVASAKEFFESPVDARTGAFLRGEMVY
ncbi:MAG TPA: ATP-binding cassette domain-containing protein [Gemmataceae bacterium]|nr:ATP-binding cassette domain-containing protein [Gemmataceae bacterium]